MPTIRPRSRVRPRPSAVGWSPFGRANGRLAEAFLPRPSAVLALAAVLTLIWLSADPQAHERFHAEAGQADHHCVVTQFSAGEAYYLAPRILVQPSPVTFAQVRIGAPMAAPARVEYVLLPSRGPPARA